MSRRSKHKKGRHIEMKKRKKRSLPCGGSWELSGEVWEAGWRNQKRRYSAGPRWRASKGRKVQWSDRS